MDTQAQSNSIHTQSCIHTTIFVPGYIPQPKLFFLLTAKCELNTRDGNYKLTNYTTNYRQTDSADRRSCNRETIAK